MKIEEIEKFGKKASGQRFLLKHLKGGHLSRKEAILAMCYDCTYGYANGMVDCQVPTCPLHDWMPYNKNKMPKKK